MKLVVLACLLLVNGLAVAAPPNAMEVEAKIRADVVAASPEAAAAWDRGNAARERMQFADAAVAYREVIALTPKLDHPHRRLCGVLDAQHQAEDAIHECELGLSLAPSSPYDKSALGRLLFGRGHGDDVKRGVALAHEAAQALPEEPTVVGVECMALAVERDESGAIRCTDRWIELAPNDPGSNLFAANVALARGKIDRARAFLETARANGLPIGIYNAMTAQIAEVARQPRPLIPFTPRELVELAVVVIGGWFAILGLLFLIGRALSRAALRHAGALVDADGAGTARERRLRATYRFVLWLTGVLFYVSLPLMIVVAIAASLIGLGVFNAMGAIPYIAIIAAIVIVATTVTSVVRALLFKPKLVFEGKRIVPSVYPKLQALLGDAAAAIGTRPVDVIYLEPGTELGVIEQRTLWQAVRGARSERILLMGVALFDNMKQRELRSVLAHEYGHFRNADTGGGLAIEVRRSLLELLKGIARSGYALFNPAWWMLRLFTNLYFSISTGASRLQEMLADRWAIRAYGSEAFVAGYRHVVAREVAFGLEVSQTIKEVTAHEWSLPNLYAYDLETKLPAAAVAAELDKRMTRAPGKWDTHPSSSQRLAWAEQLALPGDRETPGGEAPVWDLFTDPETIEREMTAIIRARVKAKLNVEISAAEWDDEPAAEPPAG